MLRGAHRGLRISLADGVAGPGAVSKVLDGVVREASGGLFRSLADEVAVPRAGSSVLEDVSRAICSGSLRFLADEVAGPVACSSVLDDVSRGASRDLTRSPGVGSPSSDPDRRNQGRPRVHRESPSAGRLPQVKRPLPKAPGSRSVTKDPGLQALEGLFGAMAAGRAPAARLTDGLVKSRVPGTGPRAIDERSVRRLMERGEGERVEFKSSLRWDMKRSTVNRDLEDVVIKALAGFLNSPGGGSLLIGVDDAGRPVGLGSDYESLKNVKGRDGFELHLRNLVVRDLGHSVSSLNLAVSFHEIDGHDICQVSVGPSAEPVYVTRGGQAFFYVRSGNGTRELPVNEAVKYVRHRWPG